ncbi:MAG: hypothetical protein MUF31_00980 [Akkermansiaceae bacterium]|nr:hypothetical protein [Akkermansiaceae bacterium]
MKSAATATRMGGLVRDVTAGLRQQMYFWGKDVVHSSGNQLVRLGMEKRKSEGLQGTSCYGKEWQGGRIELHGACAGWYGDRGGVVFIRTMDRCFGWHGEAPPVPGQWDKDRLVNLSPLVQWERMQPFLDWWISHEAAISALHGARYRAICFREFKRLPRSKPWLPPMAAMKWLRAFRADPGQLERAKRFQG